MLHVSLLGEKAITDDETGILASSSRAVALVAFLAIHACSPQARQRIAGLFWPESTDAQALTTCAASCISCAGSWGASSPWS
jgi:DNA-binding SARP family transcriptional activator